MVRVGGPPARAGSRPGAGIRAGPGIRPYPALPQIRRRCDQSITETATPVFPSGHVRAPAGIAIDAKRPPCLRTQSFRNDHLGPATFEPFERGPSSSLHAPGVGLGLSLVPRFAELHGGRAWVDDRLCRGASFHVVLGSGDAA